MSTTAFVLSGGNLAGDFECGALKFLYAYGYRPDLICGTSVGAVNGAKLAEGEGSIQSLEQIWRGLNTDNVYISNPQVGTLLGDIGTFLSSGNQFSNVAQFLQGCQDLGTFLFENATGFYVLTPLETLIQKDFNPALVASSGIKLRLVSISLTTGETLVISESGTVSRSGFVVDSNNVSSSRNYLPTEPPASTVDPTGMAVPDANIASAAAPVIYTPFIDSSAGNEYRIDGGMRHILPVNALLDTIGDANRALPAGATVFAILANPRGQSSWSATADSSSVENFCALFKIISRSILILVDEITTRDIDDLFASANLNKASVALIDPQFQVHDASQVTPDLAVSNIDYGFNRAADVALGSSQPAPSSLGLGPNATMADVTLELARLDVAFCNRAQFSKLGSALPETSTWAHDLAAEAYTFFKNPNYQSNEYASADLSWALSQMSTVQGLINARVANLLPAESLVHELTKQWPDLPFNANLMAARIGVGRTSVDLGSVPFGTSLPAGAGQVAIGNIGDQSATVSLTLAGQNPGQFLIEPSGSSASSQAQITLGGRSSALVQILPDFTQAGDFTAILNVTAPSGTSVVGLPAQVNLHVTVVAAPQTIVVSPAFLDFGLVAPKSASQSKVITLKNSGSSPLHVTLGKITATSGNAASFTTNPAAGTLPAIAPLQSTQVTVTFSPPSADGSQAADLPLQTDDPNHPKLVVALSAVVGTKTTKEVEKAAKETEKGKDMAEKVQGKEGGVAPFSPSAGGSTQGASGNEPGWASAFIQPEERPDVGP